MFGETPILHVMIWNHPIETTIKKWLFRVSGWSETAWISKNPLSLWKDG